MKDLSQKNIDHVCIVLNDNRYNRDQYGYGYGYNNKADQRKRERSLHRDNAIIQAVARSRKS